MSRICLLTGASGLFGTAFIESFAERYEIVGVHHHTPIAFATQEQKFVDPLEPWTPIALNDRAVHALEANLSRQSDVDRVVETVLSRFGRVDLLVNAAGCRHWSPLLAADALAPAQEVFEVNALAPLRLSVALAQRFWQFQQEANVEANRNVVNISSSAGTYVYPDLGQTLYAASKAAVNHVTYHMASELWDIGVRVNAVAPNTFPGRVPIEDVLGAVLELDEADVTGEVRELTGVVA